MSGQSPQEKAAEQFYNQTSGLKTGIDNPFKNYQNPYGFQNISDELDKIYGGQSDIINRDTASQIAKQKQGAVSSLASRGITGGSALTNAGAGIASNLNEGKMNALSNLGINKAGSIVDLMKYLNQQKFGTTQAGVNVDQENMNNLFRKYGLQGQALGGLDDTTAWDDILSALTTGGNVAKGAASLITAL